MSSFISFSVKLQGQEQFVTGLNTFGAKLSSLRFLWPAITAYFYEMERQQFATQGGRATKWAALRAGYAKRKALRWPGKPILQASGRLVGSLTAKNAPGAIYEETDMSLRLGSIGVGTIHQRGAPGLIARPPLEPTSADYEQIGKIAKEGIQREVEALGFRTASLS